MYHFFAMLSRMKHIDRWGLMRCTDKENLSEHSLEVAVIAHALCTLGNVRFSKNLDAERAAVVALFHDTGEIITGDMPTPIKYDNEKIRSAYKEIENSASEKLLSLLPSDIRPEYESIYFENDEYINKIVKAADKMSALIKCIEELKAGNGEFKTAEREIRKKLCEMKIPEVDIFMEEFLPSYALTLDEQRA